MNCELYLGLQCACKPSLPTGFEKSKIHQPNAEKLQVEGCKIETFLLDFVVKQTFLFKIRKEVDTQFLSKRKIELLSKSDKEKSFCFHHIFQNTNIL